MHIQNKNCTFVRYFEKEKETIALELEKANQERLHYFEALQTTYLSNEDSTDIEAIRAVYEAYQSYSTDIALLNDYWKEADYTHAQAILTRLATNYKLSDKKNTEVKQLQQLHDIKVLTQQEERSLTEKEQTILFDYIKEGETPILYLFEQALIPYNYTFPRSYQILGEDEEANSGRIAIIAPNPISNNTLTIAPNPSSDETTISWSVTGEQENVNTTLSIHDLSGRILWQETVLPIVGKIQINTQHLSNGIYYCNLKQGNENKITQKLIIIK